MKRVCKVCGKPSYNEYCVLHKPRKALKKTPLKKVFKKAAGKKSAKKVVKPKPIRKLIVALDRIFSTYIRVRDADAQGYVRCFTSGKRLWWKESQNGHFASRRHYATRWHEQNCHPQTRFENLYLSGSQYIYGINLNKVYGEGFAEKLMILAKTSFKPTVEWLEEKIKYYGVQVAKLKQQKNLK